MSRKPQHDRVMTRFGTNASRPATTTGANGNSASLPGTGTSLRANFYPGPVMNIHVLTDHQEILALAAQHPAIRAYMIWFTDGSNGAPAQNDIPVNHGPVYLELADALATAPGWERAFQQPVGVFEVLVIRAAEQLCVPISKITPDSANLRLEPK